MRNSLRKFCKWYIIIIAIPSIVFLSSILIWYKVEIKLGEITAFFVCVIWVVVLLIILEYKFIIF